MINHIRRRELILMLSGAAAWPLAAGAQQVGKRYMVGILSAGGGDVQAALASAFSDGLRELGWVEGKNVAFENRNAENRLERLPELAAELVRLKVDVIAADGTLAPLAAKQATTTIAIVMTAAGRPVGEWARCQSGAPRRQRHGHVPHGAGPGCEATRIVERASASALARGGALECGQSVFRACFQEDAGGANIGNRGAILGRARPGQDREQTPQTSMKSRASCGASKTA
jgi:hypothetical protein